MKTFVYRGFDRSGARKRGTVEAVDLKEAREKLAREKIFPEHVEPAADSHRHSRGLTSGPGSLRRSEVRAEWYRALSALLKAGLPMATALEVLLDQPGESDGASARAIAILRDRIRDGAPFAAALESSGGSISDFERAVIQAGERSGRLSDVLAEVADYLEDVGRIKQNIKTASIYPLIVLFLAFVTGTGVLGFLVPKLAALFEEQQEALPLLTVIVVGLGRWFLPLILPLLLLAMGLLIWRVRRALADEASRVRMERHIAGLPLLGRGFGLLVTLRFARTCSLLLRGGCPMVETVALAGRATGSAWLAGLLVQQSESIRHGASLGDALAGVPVLSRNLRSWIKAGEASGDVPAMFDRAAERYRMLWMNYVQRTLAVIEPALIVLVALFVLVIALAMLLPILSINQQLGW